MYIRTLIFWLVLNVTWREISSSDLIKSDQPDSAKTSERTERSTYSKSELGLSHPKTDAFYETCSLEDFACLAMAANDRLGYQAIQSLHQKLDDDANGNIDYTESDDFLREELQYDSGYEKRQGVFHRGGDMHISVKELWEAWLRSEVHNWTVEQTVEWLTMSVELPQYIPNFIQHKVTGANLPRLATNNVNYINALGIKDPIHKQKISLKAMDVVLFGPPKDGTPHWKDLTLILLLIFGGIGAYYAVNQNKKFKHHLNRMNKDMDSLQNAEKALENLQKELEVAKQVQETVITEKQDLEKKLEFSSCPTSYSDLEISQLKAEIEMLRTELQIAEGELKDRCWAAPPALQQWLQLTHEIENKAYIKKKMGAEKQLQQAREACEKLRKKRSSLVGAFVSTHGKSIDDVDRSIVEARTSLNEVTQELQERVHRWKQIEMLCGFSIINNNGLQFLENMLYRNGSGRNLAIRGRMSSQDDLDDDTGSVFGHSGYMDSNSIIASHWKEGDSSGSEISRQDEESASIAADNKSPSVQFLVGGELSNWCEDAMNQTQKPKPPLNPRSISNNNIPVSAAAKPIVRSQSHDVNMQNADGAKQPTKCSLSESALDKAKYSRPKPIKEQATAATIEEDVCSTDSSLMEDDVKKKKRKLFTFSKKNKTKGD